MNRLKDMYQEGVERGLVKSSFSSWREEVVERIRKLGLTDKEELKDSEILNFIDTAEDRMKPRAKVLRFIPRGLNN